jgi:hypothetical protein
MWLRQPYVSKVKVSALHAEQVEGEGRDTALPNLTPELIRDVVSATPWSLYPRGVFKD